MDANLLNLSAGIPNPPIWSAGEDMTDPRAKMQVLKFQAQTDPLTQVAIRGRFGFVEIANEEIALCHRYTLLERADKALYEAKRSGRDKVCVAEVCH